jgi:hypothetical protein
MPRNREKWEAQLRAKRDEYLERIRPEVLRLAEELHDGLYAPSQSEYMQFARKPVDRTTTTKAFGPWGNVAAACGLKLADAKYYYHKAKERNAEWEALEKEPKWSCVQWGQIERQERFGPAGLPALPGVRRWMDRQGRIYQQVVYMLI